MTLRYAVHLFAASLLLAVASHSGAVRADELLEINKLVKQGQYAPALDRVNSYLSAKPKDAMGRFLKGIILAEQNKPNDAIKIFSGLTEDYPELPEPYNNLAVLYAAQGQYEKARNALEMAIQTHPSYATAHENLGDIYAKMATQAYDKALQLDKSNTGAQTKLALVKELFSVNAKGGKLAIKPDAGKGVVTPPAPVATPAVTAPAIKPVTPAPAPAIVPPPTEPAKTSVKEVPAKVATVTKPAPTEEDAVLKVVHNWAKAWSDKNVSAYLAFYDKKFKPDGESRSAWESSRKDRISKPKSIQVNINSPVVNLSDSSHATVHFKQQYHSDKIKTSTAKTLSLVKSGSNWLIVKEHVGR